MRCPNEFFLAQYADGELREMGELVAHLESCAACRDRVAAFQAENRLLVRSLQDITAWESGPAPAQARAAGLGKIWRFAAGMIGAALVLRACLNRITGLEVPPWLDWIHPSTTSGRMNWFANGLFYIIEEGGSIMASLVNQAGLTVLSFLIIGGLIAVTRRRIKATALFGFMSLLPALAVPSSASDVQKAQKVPGRVVVAAGEVRDDTMIVFAESVDINGRLAGDLIAFARQINIRGTVEGNVIGFAQRVDVTGDVEGDVFGFAQTVQANGRIARNLWGFAQNLIVGSGITLGRDALLFGGEATIDGDVGRDLAAFTGSTYVGGKIGRDLHFRGGRLLIRNTSAIGRNLKSLTGSEKHVQIEPGATIGGQKTLKFVPPKPSRYRSVGFYMRQLIRLGAMFLTGFILFLLFPRLSRISLSSVREILISGGIGFLALVAIPVAAVILAITVIGLPIAAVAVALWLLLLYLAKIAVAQYVGSAITGISNGTKWARALGLVAGLLVILIAVNLPYIGGVLNFLLIVIGMGALTIAAQRIYAQRSIA